jgi:hypothetical protein
MCRGRVTSPSPEVSFRMMHIRRWRNIGVEDGAIVLVPPEGRELATIAVREGIRPIASLRGTPVVALAELIGDQTDARVATGEGELAAVIDDDRGTRAVIWGDVEQTEVTGLAVKHEARDAVAAAVREIVHHLPLGLGSVRTRRYWYQPPGGWSGTAHGFVTDWLSPDGTAMLKVLPARLLRRPATAIAVEQFLHDDPLLEFVLEGTVASESIVVGRLAGLRGRAVGTWRGTRRTYVTVGIEDDKLMYAVRLSVDGDVDTAPYEAVFDALIQSIEPRARPFDEDIARAHVVD